ncbi:hypothetical protein [Nocardia callitridis]|uniref:PE domain-containing protein n=1 Tax=Nocardia callitridis TaxID=648753 RepID=A0ABP9JXR9_9NOCA
MEFGVDPAQWRKVLDQADAGALTLHPDVGKGLDKACDDYLEHLGDLVEQVGYLHDITGFGPLPSGIALQGKFQRKATGTEQSLDAVLEQHIDAVKTMKELVAKAISNFVAQDQSRADQFGGLGDR